MESHKIINNDGMIQCLKCKNILLKPYPNHVKVGLGRCSKQPFATFYSIDKKHECADYEQAEEAILRKRIDWYESRTTPR
jgi:hypothetical protein